MSKRNNLIQTIKQEEKKNLYLDSLQLLLKLKTIQNTTPGRVCLQEVTRQYTKVVSLWIVSQLVWASLRTIKPWEDDLARCRRKPGHNTSTRHHVGVNRRVLKANALVRFSPVELPICNSLSLSFSADFVKNTTEIKHMHVCCNAMARYTEYQSIALPFQHEWWFSRSTFRWGEQKVSAGWFSTSISYNRGHFSPHRMTYEGKATALISILLWGMVAKVSFYMLSICCV